MERDRRRLGRRQRRDEVIEVALDLFEREGYDETTVEQIAATAGVSERSFYRYFDSKDGVLVAQGTDLIDQLLARTEGETSIGELARTLATISDERLDDGRAAILFRLLREEPDLRPRAALWRESWSAQLADGLAARGGRDRPSVADLVASRSAIALMAVGLDRWLDAGGRGPTTPHVDEARGALRDRL